METNSTHRETFQRAALPEVLFAPDLAVALGLRLEDAESGARAGRFGPEFYVAGRVAVLRNDFLQTLTILGDASEVDQKEALR